MTTCGSHPRSDYIDSPERPSNVQTYQTVDKLSKHVKYVDNDVSSYGLSWMVRERVISRFFKKWPPKIMKSQVSGPQHRNEVKNRPMAFRARATPTNRRMRTLATRKTPTRSRPTLCLMRSPRCSPRSTCRRKLANILCHEMLAALDVLP